MATFKVGQRVRWVGAKSTVPDSFRWPVTIPRRAEGTVVSAFAEFTVLNRATRQWGYRVVFDGVHSGHGDGAFFCEAHQIAPLVDPSADEWADAQIAKLKKLGPLPVKEVA